MVIGRSKSLHTRGRPRSPALFMTALLTGRARNGCRLAMSRRVCSSVERTFGGLARLLEAQLGETGRVVSSSSDVAIEAFGSAFLDTVLNRCGVATKNLSTFWATETYGLGPPALSWALACLASRSWNLKGLGWVRVGCARLA